VVHDNCSVKPNELDLELWGPARELGHRARGRAIGGMDEDKQPPEPHHLAEDLDTLVLQLAHIVSDARQIRARTGEALHETGGDRIAHVDKYHS
jgi:hypothetical protein